MAGSFVLDNLNLVREKISNACHRAQRPPDAVKLIAVSKTKPIELICEAFQLGQRSFGENYVQEALKKVAELPQADWHLIGSLQSNKAKQVVNHFSLIHSVDRSKLAIELAKAAEAIGCVQRVLLQVHIGSEETKSGASLDEAPQMIEQILSLPHLQLCGVMSLPPLTDDERIGRGYFALLRESFEKWRRETMSPEQARSFTELSMGTSSDFEWAILEGATFVRVGTLIFGERDYQKK